MNFQKIQVHGFGGPIWRDELLTMCQARLCEAVCSQGSGWYCCNRIGGCSTATVLIVSMGMQNDSIISSRRIISIALNS